ncbi:alpha/beta-hydrolase [Coccomyxa subellipsoidea C-169]|uniref:Alpha/beta-hydrolase n=1 Tax=Coccomyxa subellipsoidea (strain C-169) TaxID=574566 RepID=I0YS86_COCSC|nr:alpha/beta-hydrolase [Coccomyxa subellipsoidea C-169]EIE21255.1 alpha/beta-hydrolase [Coccomyxa subellipsoidea C-169]|eukprot:XP_005645799.1 alpha/beta-hydrolase [Coccomyxa subellipsoidea C-169]
MREALSHAAHLPFQMAAALTDEVAHQVEELGANHRVEPERISSQLYHEDSTQMRQQEKSDQHTAAAGLGAETPPQAHSNGVPRAGKVHSGSEIGPHPDASRHILQEQNTDTVQDGASTSPGNNSSPRPDRCVRFVNEDRGSQVESLAAEAAGNQPAVQQPTVASVVSQPEPFRGKDGEEEAAQPGSPVSQSDSAQGTSLSSSSDGLDISGSGVHDYKHYRMGKDAVLTFLWIIEIVGLAMLTQEFTLKLTDPDGAFKNQSIPVVNVVFGSLCWCALTACIVIYLMRYHTARRQGRRWKPRRKKLATLLFTELVAQWVNVTFFLVPNIQLLANPCGMFSVLVPYCAIVRWTCWNTIFLITVIQAHNSKPYWKGVGRRSTSAYQFAMLAEDCMVHRNLIQCRINNVQVALTVLNMSWAYVYFALYFLYLMQSVYKLRTLPRQDHKMSNLMLRVRLLVVAFYTLGIALLWYVKIHSCRSYMYTWYGLLPLQVVETGAAVTWSFFAMPATHLDEDMPALQVWLQEFAWTEDERAAKVERRNKDEPQGRQLAKEPMFCFEFAMNMLYWSALRERGLSLETAMGLYGLEHSELFWEKARDTKLLMAWNDSRIVIAFRGTASMSNALSDVQAWRAVHPPKRGRWGMRPLVHVGFLKSWTRGGLDIRVTSRIREIIQGPDFDPTKAAICVTGHSLGGALAQLAAHDIALACQDSGKDIRVGCYTYGSPRVGNHAFAREFDKVVPHCWHIINNQDAVARSPKFLVLYKRAGQRVLINNNGDMLVRPSFIENSILQMPGGGSVGDHLLGSYLRSLLAILLAQFSFKAFPGGMEGVGLLLDGAGITIDDLRRVSRWHGHVVNPKLASTTAAELVAAMQARRKKAAKRIQEAKAAKKGDEGKAEEPEAVEKPAEAEEEPVEAERRECRSLWQRIRRRLLVWLVVGPTREACRGNVGSRSMPAGDSDATSDASTHLDRVSGHTGAAT